jgi:hypothetical protein
MIKLIDLLKEIGDSSSDVPYAQTDFGHGKDETVSKYEFTIGEDTYAVNAYVKKLDPSKEDTTMKVSFGLKSNSNSSGSTVSTNKGIQYQVMAAVAKVIRDYVDSHPELVQITYEPSKRSAGDRSRLDLYKAYVQKSLPKWSYREESHGYFQTVYLNKLP